MFSIAICDDDSVICAKIQDALDEYDCIGEIEVQSFYSGESLMTAFEEGKLFDLIFLGIEF